MTLRLFALLEQFLNTMQFSQRTATQYQTSNFELSGSIIHQFNLDVPIYIYYIYAVLYLLCYHNYNYFSPAMEQYFVLICFILKVLDLSSCNAALEHNLTSPPSTLKVLYYAAVTIKYIVTTPSYMA